MTRNAKRKERDFLLSESGDSDRLSRRAILCSEPSSGSWQLLSKGSKRSTEDSIASVAGGGSTPARKIVNVARRS